MTIRSDILNEANALINGDREAEYGPPSENLSRIAALWGAYLTGIQKRRDGYLLLGPEDVAHLMVLLKIARAMNGKSKADTWTDMAAYAALAGEMVLANEKMMLDGGKHESR